MENVPRVENPTTSEKSRDVSCFEALIAKRDVLSSHYTMNQLRKSRKIEEMSDAEIEDYKSVKTEYNKRRELFLASFGNLNEEDGQKVSELTSLTKVEIELSKLEKPVEAGVGIETGAGGVDTKTSAGGGGGEGNDQPVVGTPSRQVAEDIAGETLINHEEPAVDAGAEAGVSPGEAESPDRGTTMDEVDRMLRYSQDTARPLEIAYWESKKAELIERQEAEANPDRPAPRGFLQRARDSYDRAKEAIMGANRISGGSETVESRM